MGSGRRKTTRSHVPRSTLPDFVTFEWLGCNRAKDLFRGRMRCPECAYRFEACLAGQTKKIREEIRVHAAHHAAHVKRCLLATYALYTAKFLELYAEMYAGFLEAFAISCENQLVASSYEMPISSKDEHVAYLQRMLARLHEEDVEVPLRAFCDEKGIDAANAASARAYMVRHEVARNARAERRQSIAAKRTKKTKPNGKRMCLRGV